MRRACPSALRNKLGLFLDFSERFDSDEVPDPYYGGMEGFEHVLDLVEDAATQLIMKMSANCVDTVLGIPPGAK
jgi:protein-tyrosine phosphatase